LATSQTAIEGAERVLAERYDPVTAGLELAEARFRSELLHLQTVISSYLQIYKTTSTAHKAALQALAQKDSAAASSTTAPVTSTSTPDSSTKPTESVSLETDSSASLIPPIVTKDDDVPDIQLDN
jgi:hypothetical protein